MTAWFVTGIDTDVGKTVVAGLMARYLCEKGIRAITAKLAQTGSAGYSDDIALHRRLMGAGLFQEDEAGVTCPYRFRFPAAPALSASMEGAEIETARLNVAFDALEKSFDAVVVEGVGGWLVPLSANLLSADYVACRGWPVIVVATPRLGSINHTLLTLESIQARKVALAGIIYNLAYDAEPEIIEDTRRVFSAALDAYGRGGAMVEIPLVRDFDKPPPIDFAPLFNGLAHV